MTQSYSEVGSVRRGDSNLDDQQRDSDGEDCVTERFETFLTSVGGTLRY